MGWVPLNADAPSPDRSRRDRPVQACERRAVAACRVGSAEIGACRHCDAVLPLDGSTPIGMPTPGSFMRWF